MNITNKNDVKNKKIEMHPLPPVKEETWLLLKEHCLKQTREKNQLITLGKTIEEAILYFIKNKN